MKKKKILTTEEMDERRDQIAEEIGDDVMEKLMKAMNVLSAAMLKRAQCRAQAQLQKADE